MGGSTSVGDQCATNFDSDQRPLGRSGAMVVSGHGEVKMSTGTWKKYKKRTKSSRSRKQNASFKSEVNDTVSLSSASATNGRPFSEGKSPEIGRSCGPRRLRGTASPHTRLGDAEVDEVDDDLGVIVD